METLSQAPVYGTSSVTEETLRYLRSTKPWVRLLSIIMFVMITLMILMGAFMALVGTFFGGGRSEGPSPLSGALPPVLSGMFPGMLLGGFYIILALIYMFPAIYLSRYASAIARLLISRSQSDLNAALRHQKSFWKFTGVMTVIGMVLGLLGTVAAVAIPLLLLAIGKGGGG